MENPYVSIQMDMHRMQELDAILNMLNEQKQKIAMAIRKTEAQKKSGVYFCGGSFFQKMDSGDCINEMKDMIKKIDTNISENREERDVLIRKLHQLGIYGI